MYLNRVILTVLTHLLESLVIILDSLEMLSMGFLGVFILEEVGDFKSARIYLACLVFRSICEGCLSISRSVSCSHIATPPI